MKIDQNVLTTYPSLKYVMTGKISSEEKWTLENLRDGFRYFNDVYGHFPSAHEIDAFKYLPASRNIQRRFGGLVELRKTLGLGLYLDHTKGEKRSAEASKAISRAHNYEEVFYNWLISIIPQVRVHEQKRLRPGNVSCDYFIYTSDVDGFAIDLFYAKDIHSLSGILSIKSKRYRLVSCKTFLVLVENTDISQEGIDKLCNNKKNLLPRNVTIFTEHMFKGTIFDLLKK